MAGIIAYTDKVSHEWYAPAGINRGGLTRVIRAYDRLDRDDRDALYESRINPIATFPDTGVVAWGQKTLQVKASALDRINVRRLLIKIKKTVASSTKYLLFEQSDEALWSKFKNIVNPVLTGILANAGISEFKVVMDETNNTPDVIDRNEVKGEIFIKPKKSAEFILLDFNIMAQSATFNN
jgi:phage tail sheath protein FI